MLISCLILEIQTLYQQCLQSYVVLVVQVEVHLMSRLRLRLKLMSVMASQGRIYVQCVTNDLRGNSI